MSVLTTTHLYAMVFDRHWCTGGVAARILLLTGKRQQEAWAGVVPGVDLPRQDRILDDENDRTALPDLHPF